MSTKAQLIERLASMPDDAVIAIPVLWTKEAAEDLWEYSSEDELTLTDEQWQEVVDRFEDADFYDEDALLDTIKEVLEEL